MAPPAEIADDHPNVLLLVVDTLRADHTSLGGYERDTTPHLDEFAKDALVYTNARASCSWTKPSVASILTGLSTVRHTAEMRDASLPEGATTLAEVFRSAGYRTALFSDNGFVSEFYGLSQGFTTTVDPFDRRAHGFFDSPRIVFPRHPIPPTSLLGKLWRELRGRFEPEETLGERLEYGAPHLNRSLLDWIAADGESEPWFAYVHYVEPHSPYAAPVPWRSKFGDTTGGVDPPHPLRRGLAPFRDGAHVEDERLEAYLNAYDAEIAWWDHCFGELVVELGARGLLDRTIVLVTSDHGEGFYEHKTWFHGNSLHDELIHVPLVLRLPGGRPAGRTDSPASLVGVAPGLLVAAGFEPPEDMSASGHAVFPLPLAERPVHARLAKYAGELSVARVDAGRKWILTVLETKSALQCFDLVPDPREVFDRGRIRPEEGAAIRRELIEWTSRETKARLTPDDARLDEQARAALEALGYLK